MPQDAKIYDFASVGETTVNIQKQYQSAEADVFPIGIMTPIQMGYGNAGLFKMSTNLLHQIRDNFRNMLSTNWGDRLMLYDFGANLEELTFELGNSNTDTEAIARIRRTTEKYMPFVRLVTFQPFDEPLEHNTGMAKIGVRITYQVEGFSDMLIEEIILYSAG